VHQIRIFLIKAEGKESVLFFDREAFIGGSSSCRACRMQLEDLNRVAGTIKAPAITRAILRRNLDAGPADSLSRLKRAAEQRYTNSQI
jgi:hypothetical protein